MIICRTNLTLWHAWEDVDGQLEIMKKWLKERKYISRAIIQSTITETMGHHMGALSPKQYHDPKTPCTMRMKAATAENGCMTKKALSVTETVTRIMGRSARRKRRKSETEKRRKIETEKRKKIETVTETEIGIVSESARENENENERGKEKKIVSVRRPSTARPVGIEMISEGGNSHHRHHREEKNQNNISLGSLFF
jgi:hypothetical protein